VLVPCFRCKGANCGKIVSFLPDIAVPYKHSGSDVIGDALHHIVGLAMAIAIYFVVRNNAGVTRSTLSRWVRQLDGNALVLHSDALPRLKVSPVIAPAVGHQSPSVNIHSVGVYASLQSAFPSLCPGEGTSTLLARVQAAISEAFPPLGLFRPRLLPKYSQT
jgi:hypothetical protein